MPTRLPHPALIPLLLAACAAPEIPARDPSRARVDPEALAREAGVPLTLSAADEVHASWKERIAQPYVFVEVERAGASLDEAMRRLFALADEAGVRASGPPFALHPEGPEAARACLPVGSPPPSSSGLEYDLLPGAMVAYALVAGPRPEVSRSHAGLLGYMRRMGWRPSGPVREIHLVRPAEVSDPGELVTEVQIPWAATR